MASKHTRKPSTRAPLARRTTKGPLDVDPLSSSTTPVASPIRSSVASPALSVQDTNPGDGLHSSELPSPMTVDEPNVTDSDANAKDLSFLLDPSIYHPLSQLDIPAPFRRPLPPLPSATTPLTQSLSTLDTLLAASDFLSASHLAGGILSSGSIRSTDTKIIFRLLGVRFSCLELTGGSFLAAQESKALEDLVSKFYYYDSPEAPKISDEDAAPPEHIIPFALRLQALRLQTIGFSDPRRGVSALYDLGIECREHIGHSATSDENRKVWRARLEEIGIRVINALIEMGDVDCARRTLEDNIAAEAVVSTETSQRIALLYLKIGDIEKARAVKNFAGDLDPLLAIADGRYTEAAEHWEAQLHANSAGDRSSLLKQNLAVAYLYAGMIAEAKDTLHGLVDSGESFESLTVNLATLYELSSDISKELKLVVAAKIAGYQKDRGVMTPLINAAFKL